MAKRSTSKTSSLRKTTRVSNKTSRTIQFADGLPDDDEEVDYENEVVYEPEIEGLLNDMRNLLTRLRAFNVRAEDEDEDHGMRWDWRDVPPPPAAMLRGHHHHHNHHRHGGPDMFGMITGDTLRGA